MKRRTAFFASAAVLAAGGGVAAGWWQARRAANAPDAALWTLRLPRPEGGAPLDLGALRGRPLLVNFWATWCPPCVEELPLLDRFARERPAWRVVGLAVDQPDPVRRFLAAHPVSFPIGMAGLDGIEWARRLGNTSGGLPFSLVFDSGGSPLRQRLGAITPADLREWRDSVH